MDTHSIRQRGGNTQIGGSLMSQSESDVLPIESPKPIAEQKSTDNVRLEMVAPAKHAVDEAKTVVRRVRTQLKKRTTVKRNTSLKRRRTRRFSKNPLLAEQLKKRRKEFLTQRKNKQSKRIKKKVVPRNVLRKETYFLNNGCFNADRF